MQISDIFYHNKKHGYDELHHLKVFLQKTWRNPVISHDFRWKSQFSPKIRQKFAYIQSLINY